jgi:hypothetical protein
MSGSWLSSALGIEILCQWFMEIYRVAISNRNNGLSTLVMKIASNTSPESLNILNVRAVSCCNYH